jgi:hypothetical protein
MTMVEYDTRKIVSEPPGDFALLDLAQRDENHLLRWFYDHFGDGSIPWQSLYQGSELADIWKTGPILIALEHQDEFRDAFIQQCAKEPLGILISAPGVSLNTLANHLTRHKTAELDGKSSLFRFYDPRSLGPLLTVLQPNQRYQLIGASQWCWYHDDQWQVTTETRPDDWPESGNTLVISNEQLKALDEARVAQFAASLTNYYRPHISAPDPEQFVLQDIKSAKTAGITLLADQERWVRLAIAAGGPLTESANWRKLASDQGLSPGQILTHLESQQRTVSYVD